MDRVNKLDKKFIFAAVLVGIYFLVFIIPEQQTIFSLSPEKSLVQPWRFLSYPFSHLNIKHLLENTLGIFFSVWIAHELKVLQFMFSTTYLAAGFLAILPLWFIRPFIALGASVAILAGLTISFFNSKQYHIKPYVLIGILTVIVFIQSIYSLFTGDRLKFHLIQDSAHFSGVLFGIAAYFALTPLYRLLTKKRRTVLRRIGD